MKKPSKKVIKSDANVVIAAAIAVVTGTRIPRGEDLLGSPELKRKFREAKAKELRRKPRGQ